MPRTQTNATKPGRWTVLLGAVCLLWAGCGKPAPADNAGPKTAAKKGVDTKAVAPAAVTNIVQRPVAFMSIFSTNDPHDPFYPKAKKKPGSDAAAAVAAVNDVEEVVKAVQRGFDAIYSFGNDRQLVMFGLPLAENVETTISVPVLGTVRRLKIKPLKVLATRAELQVEGVPRPVQVTRLRK